jgi:ABC-type siderophore export system fused ATPase/permease subunit
MLIFGVDVPLVELVFIMTIVIFIILIESIILMSLVFKQMQKTKELHSKVEQQLNQGKK